MTAERDVFGRRLKEERERRGVTLDAVVASTKINRSLLEGLERNDLSRWPHGLFGRSYIRDYAGALGLPPEPIVTEFTKLFPEADGTPLCREVAPAVHQASSLRLTLAADEDPVPTRTAWRVAAVADASAVVAGAVVVALVSGIRIWTAVGVFALVYFAVSTAWKGQSFATWWLSGEAKTKLPVRARLSGRDWLPRAPALLRALFRESGATTGRTRTIPRRT